VPGATAKPASFGEERNPHALRANYCRSKRRSGRNLIREISSLSSCQHRLPRRFSRYPFSNRTYFDTLREQIYASFLPQHRVVPIWNHPRKYHSRPHV